MAVLRLSPLRRWLTEDYVLVQAWKKSHAYIRRHNWYADSLELDVSALELKARIDEWRTIFTSASSAFAPLPMRLVPAPKSGRWKWVPTAPLPDDEARLRPLAHLSIRDQTLATAVMLCVADCIETVQGNPDQDTDAAARKGVCNYGNRLLCQWDEDRAAFSWGNTHSYRQYYTDYRRFIKRPTDVVQKIENEQGSGARLVVAHLDLSGFYDRIDRDVLLSKLKAECTTFYRLLEDDPTFWDAVRQIFSWTWARGDLALLSHFDGLQPERGLPQGLVASGCLSNAYMLDFDRQMCATRQRGELVPGCRLHDYCRYVDDMRLVLEIDETVQRDRLGAQLCDRVNQLLHDMAPGQEVNPAKASLSYHDDTVTEIRVGATMQTVQQEVSGPVDLASGRAVLDLIEGLFPLASEHTRGRNQPSLQFGSGTVPAQVASLFKTVLDVREDTVERFAAYRWRRIFRQVRPLTPGAYNDQDSSRSLIALDDRARMMAGQLLRRWIETPHQVPLLRVALDIVPRADHLDMVLQLLQQRIADRSQIRHRLTCLYIGAELLRAGSVETGYTRDNEELPSDADVEAYRLRLATFAQNCISAGETSPWYLKQQALLFLATVNKPLPLPITSQAVTTAIQDDRALLTPYTKLHSALRRGAAFRMDLLADHPYLIIAWNLLGRTPTLAKGVRRQLMKIPERRAARLVHAVLAVADDFAAQILEGATAQERQAGWAKQIQRYLRSYTTTTVSELTGGEWYNLAEVIDRADNPFNQENALLQLGLGLASKVVQNDRWRERILSPVDVNVWCRDWTRISDPSSAREPEFFKVQLRAPAPIFPDDPRYYAPSWVASNDRWRCSIGRVLRAAILGSCFYAEITSATPVVVKGYRGTTASWYKRLHGMYNGFEAFSQIPTAVSPWLGHLISSLLTWPGTQEPDNPVETVRVDTPQDLVDELTSRILHQREMYGRASGTPIYAFPIRLKLKYESKMTVVTAQTVLPRLEDFADDATLSQPGMRARHRHHLAAVLRLIHETLRARATFDRRPLADLIVLPELCVHPDDVWMVRRLVDVTRAIVFAGISFIRHPFRSDLINTGRWFLRSETATGRRITELVQGKKHPIQTEQDLGVVGFRPCQWVVVGYDIPMIPLWRLTGSICYDATDLCLAADLKNKTDGYVVAALNKDVPTFDTMVAALHYHMYQHFILVNSGQYGGSTAQAPYKEHHEKLIVHSHGTEQTSIGIFELDLMEFRASGTTVNGRLRKTPPADYRRG